MSHHDKTDSSIWQVGEWSHAIGTNYTRNHTETYTEFIESLHNRTLVVTTILVRSTAVQGSTGILFIFYDDSLG